MGVTPTYYLADFQTGDLLEPLPVGAVSDVTLSSSLRPGRAQLTVDLQAAGFSMAEGRAWVDSIRYGTKTLVPVMEGIPEGSGITSREMGEWWLCAASGTYRSPKVTISGPEWDGYADNVLMPDTIRGMVDPVQKSRELLARMYSTSQDVTVNLQSWVSHTGARIPVDMRANTRTYWAEITAMQDAEEGPFEWMTRTGLVLDGWVPRRVTRTLEVGQPRLALMRPDITLEITAPGQPLAALVDAEWSWDKRAYPSTVYGYGRGAGDDQVGPVWLSRSRVPGEPAVNTVVTYRDAEEVELYRYVRAALNRLNPQNVAFTAPMRADQYTPRKGEQYGFYTDAGWTQAAREGQAQCAGWSWSSKNPDRYDLELVEV